MIVNPDVVDVYTSFKKNGNIQKIAKKQPTENEKNTKYQNVS